MFFYRLIITKGTNMSEHRETFSCNFTLCLEGKNITRYLPRPPSPSREIVDTNNYFRESLKMFLTFEHNSTVIL